MTNEQAIIKLKSVKANLLVSIDKLAHNKTLRINEKARTAIEYRCRIEAVEIAIFALEHITCPIIT